jgi:hypothetical protein
LTTPPCKWSISGRNFAKAFWELAKGAKIMLMNGISLTFTKRVASGVDALNNPTYTDTEITIDDCLIAPITEPANAREQQAMEQSRDQVRIHLPKASDDDISHSTLTWGGKVFNIDSDSVVFMDDNTPTRWNRYFRAERVDG